MTTNRLKAVSIGLLLPFICLLHIGCQQKLHSSARTSQNAKEKMNVLFIAVDDLKPLIHSFGFSDIKTPHIDALANKSTIFTSAYCQIAVCSPSRASVLTGVYPDITEMYDFSKHIRDVNPNIVTIPQFFKHNGYRTWGVGKIYDRSSVDSQSDSISWTSPYGGTMTYAKGYKQPAFEHYQLPETRAKIETFLDSLNLSHTSKFWDVPMARNKLGFLAPSTECADVPDDAYQDAVYTNLLLEKLSAHKQGDMPFFYGIGFVRPHLPFVAPKKYWDLYDRSKIKLATPQYQPKTIPRIASHNAGELKFGYGDIIPNIAKEDRLLILNEDKQRELIHGYYASVSYIDAQIGRITKALKTKGLDKNTIIVIWGDHGFHLGDHNIWCKHSNFEQATRSPLLVYVPNITTGTRYEMPTELVDIFPTLCELTGLQAPEYLSGKSLVPALTSHQRSIKDFAISQYPRRSGKMQKDDVMGYSIRTEQYRYTEWVQNEFNTSKEFNESDIIARELYDYKTDPDETINLAENPQSAPVVQDMTKKLREFYETQKTKYIEAKKKLQAERM